MGRSRNSALASRSTRNRTGAPRLAKPGAPADGAVVETVTSRARAMAPALRRTLRQLSVRGTTASLAEALGVSPAALSQQIARLEAELGITLVEGRGRGGIRPHPPAHASSCTPSLHAETVIGVISPYTASASSGRAAVTLHDRRIEIRALDNPDKGYPEIVVGACRAVGCEPKIHAHRHVFEVVQAIVEAGCCVAIRPHFRLGGTGRCLCVIERDSPIARRISWAFRRNRRTQPIDRRRPAGLGAGDGCPVPRCDGVSAGRRDRGQVACAASGDGRSAADCPSCWPDIG